MNEFTLDFLYRVSSWNPKWLEDQKKHSTENPPPILIEISRDDKKLKAMTLSQVIPTYKSLDNYFSVFVPLILHEAWACVSQEIGLNCYTATPCFIHAGISSDSGFVLLQCETLSPAIVNYMDFVTVTASHSGISTNIFGVVRSVSKSKIENDIDRRLLKTGESNILTHFVVWIKPSRLPRKLDSIFFVTKTIPLSPILKSLELICKKLPCSPLCDAILSPERFGNVFQIDPIGLLNHQTNLNQDQYEAVEGISSTIVRAEAQIPKIFLLQGPPGTGKTHVIVQLILKTILKYNAKNGNLPSVLVCAPSNNAIDEIVIRLSTAFQVKHPEIKVVRIGSDTRKNLGRKTSVESQIVETHKKKLLEDLEDRLNSLSKRKTKLFRKIESANTKGKLVDATAYGKKLEQLERDIDEAKNSCQAMRETDPSSLDINSDERESLRQDIVGSAQVVCTTLNFSRHLETLLKFNMRSKHFLCCIVDEATQCTEPECIIPLGLGISKLVLIGDQNQLPATVISQVAKKFRFHQPLFTRLHSVREQHGVLMLKTQYRMAKAICEWPSKYFYGGKLITAENLSRNGPIFDYRVLDVSDGQEKRTEDGGYENEKEARLVTTILRLIRSDVLDLKKSVAVITYYKKQQELLIREIKRNGLDDMDLEINSVDSYQGQERDIIIISSVRANGQNVGFLREFQRMNVSLTRARESLIVCGHFQTLQTCTIWKHFFDNAKKRNVLFKVQSSVSRENLRSVLMRPELNA